MDGNRFDDLTRRFAAGTSRRSLLKRSVASVAAFAGIGAEVGADAAGKRPSPTPAPPKCPGKQTPCGTKCCCPTGHDKCGADCCSATAECCDGACCDGHCYGEELCCPTGQLVCNGKCLAPGQCCSDADCHPADEWHVCEANTCVCTTGISCEAQGRNCGELLDGECNILYHCGTCPLPQICNVDSGVCGCASGVVCGDSCCKGACYGDGQCCPSDRIVCDGVCQQIGGCCDDTDCVPNSQWHVCQDNVCICTTGISCEREGRNCGELEDGECGIVYYCGTCTAPQTCEVDSGRCVSPPS